MDLPIENGGSFHSYVSLPEGTHSNRPENRRFRCPQFPYARKWSMEMVKVGDSPFFQTAKWHVMLFEEGFHQETKGFHMIEWNFTKKTLENWMGLDQRLNGLKIFQRKRQNLMVHHHFSYSKGPTLGLISNFHTQMVVPWDLPKKAYVFFCDSTNYTRIFH